MPPTAAPTSSPFPSQSMRQAIKLALSLVLFYAWGLWTNQDFFDYGALAILLCSMGTRGATLQKGIARLIGTTFGVVVGLIILALFNHDRWATMLAFSCYLAFVAYFMQGSRNDYAWYVAAFVPLVVWGDNFPNFGNAFHFAAFRWLETTVGVLLYTVVDMLLWPRQAGDQLNQQGQTLWGGAAKVLSSGCARVRQEEPAVDASEVCAQLANARAGTFASLQQAYLDTPQVSAQKTVWRTWQHNTEALLDSLELWQQCIGDLCPLNLDGLLPQLSSALRNLEARFARIGGRWQQRHSREEPASGDDRDLLQPLKLEIDRPAATELTHFQRAALSSFLHHLNAVDQSSRQVLRCERVLAGLDSGRSLLRSADRTRRATETTLSTPRTLQPKPWLEQRFVHSLFPVVTFVTAFLFWVFWNPPTGAKVPMFAGIIGLSIVRAPVDPRKLVVACVLALLLAVAPIYWFVMPRLDNGFELLVLIFVYSLLFGWLGGHNPILKIAPMLEFIMATGISNSQRYSFNGMVDGALMTVMGGGFVALAYMFFTTMRAENTLLRWVKRFFTGCARYTGEFNMKDLKQRARNRRALQSMVLPAPAKIQAAQKQLDDKLFPDSLQAEMDSLRDCVQSIAYRLQALETVIGRASSVVPGHHEALAPLSRQVQETIEGIFQRWAKPESDLDFAEDRTALERVSGDFRVQLDTLAAQSDEESLGEQALAELYTIVGCTRGLIDALASTQAIMQQINWHQLATPRF